MASVADGQLLRQLRQWQNGNSVAKSLNVSSVLPEVLQNPQLQIRAKVENVENVAVVAVAIR
jgi:hypothetical protein